MRSESWYRNLNDGRLEVCLVGKAGDAPIRVRASGMPDLMWKVVEHFETLTGEEVTGEWRRPPRRGQRQIRGQMELIHGQG